MTQINLNSSVLKLESNELPGQKKITSSVKSMTNITFHNSSNQRLMSIAKVAIPQNVTLPKFPVIKLDANQVLPLLFNSKVGDLTNIYTVWGNFPPGNFSAEIQEGDANVYATYPPFNFSNWVLKNPIGTILRAKVTTTNGDVIPLSLGGKLENIRNTQHCQTFKIESPVVQGFKLLQFLTVYNNLDHVEFSLALNWHDRNNPDLNIDIASIRLECNDEFVIRYQDQMGLPRVNYQPMIDNWYLDIVPTATQLRDGQGLELRGMILTMPENFIIDSADKEIALRIQNLNAVKDADLLTGKIGEVIGVYEDLNYDNNWFNSYLPKLNNLDSTIPDSVFLERGIFGLRSIGSGKLPGQTGWQQDFGGDKGFESTVLHDPRWILMMKGVQADRLRYFNIHEPDGSKVTKEKHPGRQTWNMETFPILSTDLLGKDRNQWAGDGTGWMGYDTQHRSQNGVLTYYALTGDDLTLDTLQNALEADLAQARNLSLADREVGRTFNCWAKMLRVLPAKDKERLKSHCVTKLSEFLSDWRGRFATIQGDQNKTVRVLQVIQDPRTAIVNPVTGKLEPTWIPYQCAQLVQGLYSLSLELEDRRILPVLKDLTRSFLNHGCFFQNNTWYVCLFARYVTGLESGKMVSKDEASSDEGIPLPASSYHVGSWEIYLDLESNSGWWDWVGPCVAIGKLILDDNESKERATNILNNVYPEGLKTIQSASWYVTPL
jgi:hypothetical protein